MVRQNKYTGTVANKITVSASNHTPHSDDIQPSPSDRACLIGEYDWDDDACGCRLQRVLVVLVEATDSVGVTVLLRRSSFEFFFSVH